MEEVRRREKWRRKVEEFRQEELRRREQSEKDKQEHAKKCAQEDAEKEKQKKAKFRREKKEAEKKQRREQSRGSPYRILLLPPREATDETVRKAFYRACLIHHPDKGGNPETFKLLMWAYTVVKTEAARKAMGKNYPVYPYIPRE
jgi:hypothetical protein